MKLIFFKGMVNTLDHFTDQFIAAAERREVPYLLLNAHEDLAGMVEKLIRFCEDDTENQVAAVLFNNVLLPITYGGGKSLGQIADTGL